MIIELNHPSLLFLYSQLWAKPNHPSRETEEITDVPVLTNSL